MAKKSRAMRYGEAILHVGIAHITFETLQGELQDWLDNMPENLQESTKAEELQTAIDDLEDAISAAEEITEMHIKFPGMCR